MANLRIGKRYATIAIVFGIVTMAGTANAQSVTIDEFALPFTAGAIAADPDGSVWFGSSTGPTIGHRSLSGEITTYPYPGAPVLPQTGGIIVGRDDNLWFGELSGDGSVPWYRIGRMSRTGSDFHEFIVPPSIHGPFYHHTPRGLIAGPDGNIWFAVGADALGRITTDGTITLFYLPEVGCPPPGGHNYGNPQGVAVGSDGALWLGLGSGYGMMRFDIETEEFNYVPIAPCGTPTIVGGITTGPDGNLWAQNYGFAQLYRVSPAGDVTTFAFPGNPSGIASVGGALFVSRLGFNDIARVDPSTGAVLATFPVPTPMSGPVGLTPDAAGNIWFVEAYTNKIGRLPNPLPCHHALTLGYDAGTLNLSFALGNQTPAYWQSWALFQDRFVPLWAVAIPRVSPAVFFNVPLTAFPSVGTVGVLTVLITSDLNVCADWKVVDTGGVIAARQDFKPPITP
jgi:streptogramin lyase